MRRPEILPDGFPGDVPTDVLRCCGQQTLEAHCEDKSEAGWALMPGAAPSSMQRSPRLLSIYFFCVAKHGLKQQYLWFGRLVCASSCSLECKLWCPPPSHSPDK